MAGNKTDYSFMEDEYIRKFCEKYGDVLEEKLSESLFKFRDSGYLMLSVIRKDIDFTETFRENDEKKHK